jgi:hypothetical protein
MARPTYWHDRYAAQRAKGECVYHKGVPPLPGKARCARCDASAKRYRKERYQRARRCGQCVNHLAHKVQPGFSLCAPCLARARERYHAKALERRRTHAESL